MKNDEEYDPRKNRLKHGIRGAKIDAFKGTGITYQGKVKK